ncbi:MAG TPA: efflux RND transporter permease subunit [Terriglobia bacterium]|nr:efflux RND transporter permease subunit [Terriglobia bacterium]
MMWLVRVALNRPYTFVVASLLILILSLVAILRTPSDIFPDINIPVVSMVWSYTGLAPEDIEQRMVTLSERFATTVVNDIEHIESQSHFGLGIIKIFFQQGADINGAIAQVTAVGQPAIKYMPPGATPPLVVAYTASSVPILQLGLSSPTLSEGQVFDLGVNFLRVQLADIEGAAIPYPFGGKQRQVSVDLDPQALLARRVSGAEVVSAISSQNLILPQGTIKLGRREYDVELNSSPRRVGELNDLPIKVVNGTTVYVRDVAHVHDGFQFQTNIVHVNGHRSALLTIYKTGKASTLDIVRRVRAELPRIQAGLPSALKVDAVADQSLFVRAAIQGVLREATIAALLTAAMILVFLGSWRMTFVVATSIPLAILTSVLTLSTLGETINMMTLGGLALAVGILVDDATVEVENTNRLLPEGKSLRETILTSASQIATPALVGSLSICIVFVPVMFLTGISGFLFRPLAEAVVFAMLASYLLSRTLVPTMMFYFYRSERRLRVKHESQLHRGPGFFYRFHKHFEGGFERFRERFVGLLEWCLHHRLLFGATFLGFCLASLSLALVLGSDLFPTIDAGQMRLHLRGQTGLRIEETANLCQQVEQAIRQVIPPGELHTMLDNSGMPYSGINLTYSNSGVIGTSDAEILISLNPEHHPTADYIRMLRRQLPKEFPGTQFSFQPADIVSQILNFGLPSPIDVQIVGANMTENFEVAQQMVERIRQIPGAADVHVQQALNEPVVYVDVDRTKAQGMGFTQTQVASNTLVALATSFQTAPSFWISPQGVNYSVITQTPQYRMDTLGGLRGIPIVNNQLPQPEILANLVGIRRGQSPAVISHYDVQRVIDVYATTQGRDLGGVAAGVDKVIDEFRGRLPRGSFMIERGQVETMRSSFAGLEYGILFAVLLVYLLMVVNFQSWLDPFIMITALPGAMAGIVWMLFVTRTTINVPSLMGAIMCIGVATSNSILLITFATGELKQGKNSTEAALAAAFTRLRPVLMTALAMIIGMLPMALGIGEGAEQNAPLGRAVIGGLVMATVATLFFVPVVFSYLRRKGYHEPMMEEIEPRG